MEGLIQPDLLRTRIALWAEEESRLGRRPARAAVVAGTSERSARRVIAALLDAGVLRAESARAPLKLAFPAALAGRWMPGLFPEKTEL